MQASTNEPMARWGRFEQAFESSRVYGNPIQDVQLTATFVAPSGHEHQVDGFWDGGATWRVRFMPGETGEWSYHTSCSDQDNAGLHGQAGRFRCQPNEGQSVFERHGALRLAPERTYLEHADGTPWLWLADTAWNGPLLSTADEWEHYLAVRRGQGFSAVQWVTTQWIAAPTGDLHGQQAYHGREQIAVNPAFFQRLDGKLDAINRAGLLGVPVLLWAATWTADDAVNSVNPGVSLPEDQAILLERYMVARWGANHVAWILNGDGDYRGEKAERWRRIGRAVFGNRAHAPVLLHPSGMNIPFDEFRDEAWLDIITYQSGHGDDAATQRWIWDGPPAQVWRASPTTRPVINVEPPYEDHIAYQSGERISAHTMRRATYWSLLIAPTAGVSYGGHGVWGWDDGTITPTAHPGTGVPLPWQKALYLPGAEQFVYLATLFQSVEWWRLRPAPSLVRHQPGDVDPSRYIAAARSNANDLAVIYTPVAQPLELDLGAFPAGIAARWFQPETGVFQPANAAGSGDQGSFTPPGEGDWVLVLGNPLPA